MPTVKQLQAELAAAKAEITRLKQQNASLLERLAHASNAIASKKPVSTLVSSPTGISSTYVALTGIRNLIATQVSSETPSAFRFRFFSSSESCQA
ncbi:hypothetical protein G6F57_012324 [Rhizopus arrhizus]|nr:hypothetical protein G6F17_011848 [Rhizopus arrhizus]KAG0869275.1 hypothetical protein G6F15_011960 [Rhizopus arrhizus]KAG0929708.1 hypothetical protein G6F30_011917 [Rhizopus arrhizus]KAG0931354.1 hypothetical protein G6F32_011697 [Rhizopus arrhizus]KAG0959835.1 hypothetical protein G6F31_011258 [Rhizopus arrhizus]